MTICKSVSPETLGYSKYDCLTRGCSLRADGLGDGYLTKEELRIVAQNHYDTYELMKDQLSRSLYEESQRMLGKMSKEIQSIDYLPENLRGIDQVLRPRAA
jgi:hypothetical protein